MKTWRIWSLDSWTDCCGCECEENKPMCWTVNNQHLVEDLEIDFSKLNDEQIIELFVENHWLSVRAQGQVHIENCGEGNFNILSSDNYEPLYYVELR